MSTVSDLPAPLQALFGDAHDEARDRHMRQVLQSYGDNMSRGDAAGVFALFAPDAVIYDPVGSPARSGDAIFQFYQGSFDAMGGFIEMRLEGDVRASGEHAAASYIARMTMDGHDVIVETLDVMKFDSDGLIASMHAYWGPSNVKPGERAPVRLA